MAKKNEYKQLRDELKSAGVVEDDSIIVDTPIQRSVKIEEDLDETDNVNTDEIIKSVHEELIVKEKENPDQFVHIQRGGVVSTGIVKNEPTIIQNVPLEKRKPTDEAKKNVAGIARNNSKGTFSMGGKIFRNQ